MKRFRTVTMLTLIAIGIMVTANIVYLHSLYGSIKEQSLQTATECLRRADIMEILSRIGSVENGNEESSLRVSLLLVGERTTDGSYHYPNLMEDMEQKMSDYFHLLATITPDMSERDATQLAEIFRQELAVSGLYPKEVIVGDRTDNSMDYHKFWKITVNDKDGKHILVGYISPLTGYVFNRMSGIVVTSASILLLMSFLIWYLLNWVGRLRSIEQMKDDFTHNMTHELKTPVAVAYSAADSMMRYYDQSDEMRNKKLLSIIMQRLNFLSGMIENILSMSMERFKTMKLNVEKVAIKPIVEEVASMIEMKTDKPVMMTVDIEDGTTVSTDPLHFGNMISNLLDNAVKYSGDNVEIIIAGNNHHISVSDNGIGISQENQLHIFDKFYRVTDGDRYEVGGYGLGLYYVKQLATMLGWSISVESDQGRGTKFTINFDGDEKK